MKKPKPNLILAARLLLCDDKLGPILKAALGEDHAGVSVVREALRKMFNELKKPRAN